MASLKGKRIIIFQQRGWAISIGHFLAKKLQNEGCKLSALTLKPTTHAFVTKQTEVRYDLIINNDQIMSRPKEYLNGEKFSMKEICAELGIDSIWPIVMSLRNHVKSYKDKYYYSFKQNVSDEEILDYVMAVYKCIKYFFKEFNPELIITPNFVALPHIMFNLYAKKRGIKMMSVTDTKISGYNMFVYNYQDNEGQFYERIDALNKKEAVSDNLKKAEKYINEFREKFKNPEYAQKIEKKQTLIQKIRHFGSPFYHILKWYTDRPINYIDSTGITPDYRPPKIIWRDHYCRDNYIKWANNYKYFPFEKLEKTVYFPLQVQPEMTIDVAAPFFSNQIETARLVAMSLPDDYTLAVKEHPAMIGLRPPSYLEKIDRTANVKLIDYRIPSEKIMKKADMIVSPSGTSIAEAAFLKKPAIQLGDLGTTQKLPNVFRHTDMRTLSKKIKEVLLVNLNTDEYELRLKNYVSAVFDTGFNLNYFEIWEKSKTENIEKLWSIYKKEIERVLC